MGEFSMASFPSRNVNETRPLQITDEIAYFPWHAQGLYPKGEVSTEISLGGCNTASAPTAIPPGQVLHYNIFNVRAYAHGSFLFSWALPGFGEKHP